MVNGMVRLLEEIPLRFAPHDCKEWFVKHVAERKIKLVAEKVEHKAASVRAKAKLKAKRATEVSKGKIA